MMNKILRMILPVVLILALWGCNDPVTMVTNIVNRDGSILRRINIRSTSNKFEPKDLQVPIDGSWTVRDSVEVSAKGDTTWLRTAEKLFGSAEMINREYERDSSANNNLQRIAGFSKRFRWFNTFYRFSETIGSSIKNGVPLSEYLNDDELKWFYTPGDISAEKMNGPDSLMARGLNDTVTSKVGKWENENIVRSWVFTFNSLTGEYPDDLIPDDTLSRRTGFRTRLLTENEEVFDSLWDSGVILQKYLGKEDVSEYLALADSAEELMIDRLLLTFKDYEMRIIMPGSLTGTNGFVDSSDCIRWDIKSDYFLAEDFVMWGESRDINWWAWVLTLLFLLFVSTGFIYRKKRKG